MAILVDVKACGALALSHSFRSAIHTPKNSLSIRYNDFGFGRTESCRLRKTLQVSGTRGIDMVRVSKKSFGIAGTGNSQATISQDIDGFLLNTITMSFVDRLRLAWRILFPNTSERRNSNASIAKQRLKMILFSDRCDISDEAKQKIVRSIIEALSDFVEIESQDKVHLSVSTDPSLGTIYSVAVPVRRVKPEYQESVEDLRGKIIGVEYKDNGESSGLVDVTFDFYIPSEKKRQA